MKRWTNTKGKSVTDYPKDRRKPFVLLSYRTLAGVNEGSIVYRGAQPNTCFDLTLFDNTLITCLKHGYRGMQPWQV